MYSEHPHGEILTMDQSLRKSTNTREIFGFAAETSPLSQRTMSFERRRGRESESRICTEDRDDPCWKQDESASTRARLACPHDISISSATQSRCVGLERQDVAVQIAGGFGAIARPSQTPRHSWKCYTYKRLYYVHGLRLHPLRLRKQDEAPHSGRSGAEARTTLSHFESSARPETAKSLAV